MSTLTLARLFAFISLLSACTHWASAAESRPEQAYIRAAEHGQALLLSRLGECYAVTPEHVIDGELFATLTGGSGGAPQGDGDLLQTFGYDLSILRVSGSLARSCGGPLGNVPALDKTLSASSIASVSSINEDGSISRRDVTLNDVGLLYIRIRPEGDEDQLFKGLSGSLLLVGDRPAGILMSVDPDTGEGRALRYDRAIETLRPFFGLPGRAAASTEKPPAPADSKKVQASVTSWSSPPLNAQSRASNLTDADDSTRWLAQAGAFPLELVIELPGDKAHVVHALQLVGAGVEPRQRLPRDFEVLISATGRGNWIPVTSATYFMNDTSKQVSFAPVRARQIMLRIYSNWGDSEAVGLSGINIPSSR